MLARSRTWPVNANVVNVQPHEVATAQFAVDREIEQCEVAPAPLKLEPNADCPDLLWFQGAFLANQLALVPWASREAHQGRDRAVHDSLLDPNPARRSAGHPLIPRRHDQRWRLCSPEPNLGFPNSVAPVLPEAAIRIGCRNFPGGRCGYFGAAITGLLNHLSCVGEQLRGYSEAQRFCRL
jgi:hypothetical protein